MRALLPLLLILAGCTPAAQPYFCPDVDCGEVVQKELRSAEHEVLFAAYSFTHPGVATELIALHANGVDVRGIVEKRGSSSQYSQYQRLLAQGIDVRNDTNTALMHNKFFVIDRKEVITGSYNPTRSATTRNDENIIIVRDRQVAAGYTQEALRLLNRDSH